MNIKDDGQRPQIKFVPYNKGSIIGSNAPKNTSIIR